MRKLFYLSILSLAVSLPAAAQDPALQDPFKTSGKVISFNRLNEDDYTYGGLMSLQDGGKILVEGPSWDVSLVHDGFATIDSWDYEHPDKRFFFVDEDGKKAFGGRFFEGAGTFSEGKVFVAQKGRIQCMDTAGKVLFTLPKDALYALPFREGYAFYKAEGGWWLVDENGKDAFEHSFADAQPFVSNGRAVVADGETGLWGILDVETGNDILPFKYAYLGNENFAYLTEWVRFLGGSLMPFSPAGDFGHWGILDISTGKQVVKPVYYNIMPSRGGFYLNGEDEDKWLDAKTKKMAPRPDDPELPAALKGVYASWWTFPITGTDLYAGRQESDMKSVIVRKDGKVVVAPTGYSYPFFLDKEQMSPDYLARCMVCARDEKAQAEVDGRYIQADGDGMDNIDLTYYDPDSMYEKDDFMDWLYSVCGDPVESSDVAFNLKDIFLGTKPMKGILGNDRKEISVWFTDARETKDGFSVKGKSSVSGGADCSFSGELTTTLLSVLTMENGKDMYMLFGTYYLEEDPGQKGSGVFEGNFNFYLEPGRNGDLVLVKDRSMPQEQGYDMNKTFVGTWTSHRTGASKRCTWSDGFVPFSQPY